jgi:hypothetical protein
MVTVVVGSDTYGSVKKVGPTPVVTRFEMFSGVPLIPEESYYFVGFGETTWEGIPLLFHRRTTEVHGIPLALLDGPSVLMAYFRGLCGAMVVVGFLAIVPGIMALTGEHLDDLALKGTTGLVACLVLGVVAGLASYMLPFPVLRREKAIRSLCGTVLGICADPAKIRKDYAELLRSTLDETLSSEAPQPAMTSRPDEDVYRLVEARNEIALGGSRERLENLTDDLLERIRIRASHSM